MLQNPNKAIGYGAIRAQEVMINIVMDVTTAITLGHTVPLGNIMMQHADASLQRPWNLWVASLKWVSTEEPTLRPQKTLIIRNISNQIFLVGPLSMMWTSVKLVATVMQHST
jgi:hypothetical protein